MQLKAALQQTVVDPAYVKKNYKDTTDTSENGNGITSTRQNRGGTAKSLVLNDGDVASGGFWSRVEEHAKLTLPSTSFYAAIMTPLLPRLARYTMASSKSERTSRHQMRPIASKQAKSSMHVGYMGM